MPELLDGKRIDAPPMWQVGQTFKNSPEAKADAASLFDADADPAD